jgi:hypothetical protein
MPDEQNAGQGVAPEAEVLSQEEAQAAGIDTAKVEAEAVEVEAVEAPATPAEGDAPAA